ncbi:MAG: hypothetical protein RLZZ196_1078 [Bacteroidota bacterium]|jgi:predicted RND superfamily exporter protein
MKFVEFVLNNPITLGMLCFALVMFPIIGIAKIHDTSNERRSSRDD